MVPSLSGTKPRPSAKDRRHKLNKSQQKSNYVYYNYKTRAKWSRWCFVTSFRGFLELDSEREGQRERERERERERLSCVVGFETVAERIVTFVLEIVTKGCLKLVIGFESWSLLWIISCLTVLSDLMAPLLWWWCWWWLCTYSDSEDSDSSSCFNFWFWLGTWMMLNRGGSFSQSNISSEGENQLTLSFNVIPRDYSFYKIVKQ